MSTCALTTATALVLAAAALLIAGPAHGLPPTPVRRQVLPPVPGYIPVYIQHGDVAPEDTVELADLFRVAGDNLPPADVVSDALFGTPTVLSPISNPHGTDGSNLVSDKTDVHLMSTAPTDEQDNKQPITEDAASEQLLINSELGTPAAAVPVLSQGEADNDGGDPATWADEENSGMHEIINLEPFPDKLEIGPDKIKEMIDASKVDVEESQSNNAEQTSPASEGQSEPEMLTTEETTAK